MLKRELGAAILRDIRFGDTLVTVSGVDITPDLKQAHVFVSALGTPGEQRDVLEQLEKSRARLQHELARRVTLKHTPHLNFRIDEALARGSRVLGIMNELGLDEDV